MRDVFLRDVNEDGNLDVLLIDKGVDLILLLGNGDGTFQQATNLGLNAVGFPSFGDLNGDGHLDFVALTREGAAMVFLGVGDGTFTSGVTLDTVTNPYGERQGQTMIGDLNGDGKLDIAVASTLDTTTTWTGNLDVFLGRGNGTFENPIRNPNVATYQGTLGDFNGDGILDFAGDRRSPEAVEIWLGQGDGHFRKIGSYSMSGYWPVFIKTADLNGDGLQDILVTDLTMQGEPASMAILLGKGDGTFQPRRLFTALDGVTQFGYHPAIVDMNQDGALDIVSVTFASRDVVGPLALNLNRGSTSDRTLGFQVSVRGSTNRALVLERSVDLRAWSPIATNTPAGDWSVVDANSARRFYRTRAQ